MLTLEQPNRRKFRLIQFWFWVAIVVLIGYALQQWGIPIWTIALWFFGGLFALLLILVLTFYFYVRIKHRRWFALNRKALSGDITGAMADLTDILSQNNPKP